GLVEAGLETISRRRGTAVVVELRDAAGIGDFSWTVIGYPNIAGSVDGDAVGATVGSGDAALGKVLFDNWSVGVVVLADAGVGYAHGRSAVVRCPGGAVGVDGDFLGQCPHGKG